MKHAFASVIFVLVALIVPAARADGMNDSNTTSDTMSATVDAGYGDVFTCFDDPGTTFFCSTEGFTCWGIENCEALGASNDSNLLAAIGVVVAPDPGFATLDQAPFTATTPEPSTLALFGAALLFAVRRRRVA